MSLFGLGIGVGFHVFFVGPSLGYGNETCTKNPEGRQSDRPPSPIQLVIFPFLDHHRAESTFASIVLSLQGRAESLLNVL
jgi:hypothetical protein